MKFNKTKIFTFTVPGNGTQSLCQTCLHAEFSNLTGQQEGQRCKFHVKGLSLVFLE